MMQAVAESETPCIASGLRPESVGSVESAEIKPRPFTRDSRLRAQNQFDYVRSQGRKQVGSLMVLQWAPPQDGQSRMAAVISRRYSTKAVERNRARRLFREAYRKIHGSLQPAWIIIVPRWRMKDIKLKLSPVQAELIRLCTKAGLR